MTVQLDTSEVAPAKRSAFWAAGTARLLGPVGVRSLVERPFSGRILGHHLGPIEVFRVAGDANRVQRTAADVALLDPQRLHLNLLTRGTLLAAQGGRSSRLRAGDITSFDWSRPFVAQATGRFEILAFTVPLAMLGEDGERVRARTALRLGGDGGLPQVAGPFFIGIAAGLHDGSIDPEDPVLADAIVGLVRALHGERQAQVRALPRSVARADGLLQRIKDHIDLHLREPDLGPERIAKAHFISTRYVHKLFQPEGMTVSRVDPVAAPGGGAPRPRRSGVRRPDDLRAGGALGLQRPGPVQPGVPRRLRLLADRGPRRRDDAPARLGLSRVDRPRRPRAVGDEQRDRSDDAAEDLERRDEPELRDEDARDDRRHRHRR